MTISIFLPQTNSHFSITLFVSCKMPISGEPLAPLFDAEKVKLCKLPSTYRERGDTGSWRGMSWTAFLLQADRTWIHAPARSAISHAFWRTWAVHLAGREIEHLFFMEREWARANWDRRACRRSCVPATRLSVRGNDRQQIREAVAQWLTPALSDWQRKTHHRSSSLLIHSVLLEATLSAGCRNCFVLHNGGFWSWRMWPDVKEMASLVPYGGQRRTCFSAINIMWQLKPDETKMVKSNGPVLHF